MNIRLLVVSATGGKLSSLLVETMKQAVVFITVLSVNSILTILIRVLFNMLSSNMRLMVVTLVLMKASGFGCRV